MNKAQLVEAIADKLGGRQQAADAVDAVLDAMVRAVVAGDRVSVTGFGSFEKVDRPARYARNPQTGERVRVKKTSVPRFRAGQGFTTPCPGRQAPSRRRWWRDGVRGGRRMRTRPLRPRTPPWTCSPCPLSPPCSTRPTAP